MNGPRANRRLPPLKALRAFEAAGRLGSYQAAAEELGVAAGAIKRQIKALENHFQVSLTERHQPDIVLTTESRNYLSLITEVFRELEAGTVQISGLAPDPPLHLLTPLTLANRWLLPLLPGFRRLYPEIGIQLILSRLRNIPGSSGDVDITLQLGASQTPGFRVEPLMRAVLIAVCSPACIAPGQHIGLAELISSHTLLYASATGDPWARWLQPDAHLLTDAHRLNFAIDALAIQAAELGMGVAIADRALVQEQLSNGSLVCPIERAVDTQVDWVMIYREEAATDPRIANFCRWLREQPR